MARDQSPMVIVPDGAIYFHAAIMILLSCGNMRPIHNLNGLSGIVRHQFGAVAPWKAQGH